MKRPLVLTIALGVLCATLAAAPIDPAPMMSLKDMKALPGTPVPIVVPAPPKPCAPILKGELKELPGAPVPLNVPKPVRR